MKVLQQLASCDEPLVYFGGFWTVPSLETGMRKDVAPTWYTHANTVKSLEKLGLLKQTGTSRHYPIKSYPALSDRILSAQGLSLATGYDVPMEKLVQAVTDYTGHALQYRSFQRLNPREWKEVISQDSRLTSGTAAFTSDDNDIVIRVGFETDALHELVHAAGVKPDPHDAVFICEGITQAASEEIATKIGVTVKPTYDKEVSFVRRYLIPTTGLPLRKLVNVYIEDGILGLSRHIMNRCGHLFRDKDGWGSLETLPRRLEEDLRHTLGASVYLGYLVDGLRIGPP